LELGVAWRGLQVDELAAGVGAVKPDRTALLKATSTQRAMAPNAALVAPCPNNGLKYETASPTRTNPSGRGSSGSQ